MKVTVVILLVILLIVFSPLVSIWALNTLFPVLAIPYTFKTWLSVILVKIFILTSKVYK
jgi:hypothetical protein